MTEKTSAAGAAAIDPPRHPWQGIVLAGQYVLEREIAEGGTCVLWLGRQMSPNRPVAVKILALGEDVPHVRARFLQEAELMATLQHPSIAQVFYSGEETVDIPDLGQRVSLTCIVMEYLGNGESLEALLTRGADACASQGLDGGLTFAYKSGAGTFRTQGLSLEVALNMFRQIAGAVSFMHDQANIIHRDVKPDNVMVLPDGRVKLLDLGIAKAPDRPLKNDGRTRVQTMTGTCFGTPPYMAPEQLISTADVDTRADVYALGCVLYEMLMGMHPYADHKPKMDLMDWAAVHGQNRVQMTPPTLISRARSTLPRWLDAWMQLALAHMPNQRFQSVDEMVKHLGPSAVELLSQRQPVGNPESPVSDPGLYQRTSLPPFSSSQIMQFLLAASFALALVTGLAFGMKRWRAARVQAVVQPSRSVIPLTPIQVDASFLPAATLLDAGMPPAAPTDASSEEVFAADAGSPSASRDASRPRHRRRVLILHPNGLFEPTR